MKHQDSNNIWFKDVQIAGPLQATEGNKFEARMLYRGDVTDAFWGSPRDAHTYEPLTGERIRLRVELSQ